MTQTNNKFLIWVAVISLAMNVCFSYEVHSLRNALEATQTLDAGTKLSTLSVLDKNNQLTTLEFSHAGQATVIYVFSPTCHWCAKNLDDFKALYNLRSHAYRFVGLSLDSRGLPKYVQDAGMTMPIYNSPSPEDMHTFHLGSTPQTIVISQNGVVLQSWEGIYQGSILAEVDRFFRLPSDSLKPVN